VLDNEYQLKRLYGEPGRWSTSVIVEKHVATGQRLAILFACARFPVAARWRTLIPHKECRYIGNPAAHEDDDVG
jgi:hypothetical protein